MPMFEFCCSKLILFIMNHGERERCRANSVNTCSICSPAALECQLIDLSV